MLSPYPLGEMEEVKKIDKEDPPHLILDLKKIVNKMSDGAFYLMPISLWSVVVSSPNSNKSSL